eukprot:TRINITY_DN782144_c0_g1_i1.p1 TRINITY_DN782144_c0_g1~~TRINITY_DN782144_c0_g1_i1.p1  ORF type:complete len:228 (+),score=53.29 TRINITY_DN782144_c0_g1_i1:47-730(+)
MKLVICLLTILVVVFASESTRLNIHVKLDQRVEELAIGYNAYFVRMCPNEDIFLQTYQQPHITLYLTEFQTDALDSIISAANDIVKNFPSHCIVELQDATATGSYTMWHVKPTSCLQRMSDKIVEATSKYAIPNQPIPDWIAGLKNATMRAEKINYVKKYGSPNVFSQFQPHVTLSYDAKPVEDDVAHALELADVHPTKYVPHVLALGTVGPHGTCMRNEDFHDYHF